MQPNINKNNNLTRIGVFYDGNFFLHVSNYYNYQHSIRSRLRIGGLHFYLRQQIALLEKKDLSFCQIIDSHFFRGRMSAKRTFLKENQLYFDRVFDDILMAEGVITHYLPVKYQNGSHIEKGIDVWLALEAFELAIYKQFDILVLIAADGDYNLLIRKLNSLGVKVMLLQWNFSFTDNYGQEQITRTSSDLLEEVTYPVPMHHIIDDLIETNDPILKNLFLKPEVSNLRDEKGNVLKKRSVISLLKDGYGFIKYPPKNLFFHYNSLVNCDFNELEVGDLVEFLLDKNDRDERVAVNVRLID